MDGNKGRLMRVVVETRCCKGQLFVKWRFVGQMSFAFFWAMQIIKGGNKKYTVSGYRHGVWKGGIPTPYKEIYVANC